MITLGMHTCLKNGGKEKVLKEAPFLGKHNSTDSVKERSKLQFLGQGYYYWDNNFEMAKIWGKTHCQNNYYILECEIDISAEKCLDLVGNRYHQIFITETIERLKKRGLNRENWEISKCIEYLKRLSVLDINVFPYENIRALDYLPPEDLKQIEYFFVTNNKHYTVLNPKIAICVIDKKSLPLQKQKIIFES